MNSAGSAPQFPAQSVGTNQASTNAQTAIGQSILNSTNQVTPYGSLTYNQTGGQNVNGNFIPQYTATTSLSPEQQGLYEKGLWLQNQGLATAGGLINPLQRAINTPLSFAGAPPLPQNQDALRNQAYNALTARSTEDLNRARSLQETQLANQGINAGSTAWNRAEEMQNRAVTDASNQATINAGNIAGQNLQQAQSLRDQYINELQAQRNQPLADYQALLGLSGGVQSPSFVPTPQTQFQPTDVTAPAIAGYQGQVNAYNQQLGQQNALMGGLFGLGGSVLGGIGLAGAQPGGFLTRMLGGAGGK